MKFGMSTQNEMLMAIGKLKLKPEVEFQFGGSSYNSAVE